MQVVQTYCDVPNEEGTFSAIVRFKTKSAVFTEIKNDFRNYYDHQNARDSATDNDQAPLLEKQAAAAVEFFGSLFGDLSSFSDEEAMNDTLFGDARTADDELVIKRLEDIVNDKWRDLQLKGENRELRIEANTLQDLQDRLRPFTETTEPCECGLWPIVDIV